jgi:class 3 adenylate cyclase/tetratricopeptide (TPR) repeat protein
VTASYPAPPAAGVAKQGGVATPPTIRQDGERRQVTVLFADVVGFTEFTAKAGAEHAYALMQRISKLLSEAVQEQGCVVKNFTGDGILALFGAPAALEDAPLRACRAALLIEQRLAAAADEIEVRHGARPQLRMSINSGPVVFGEVTEGEIASVTAHGDIVNLGSRLLAAAEPGTILIGEETQRLVEGMVQSRFAGVFQFKGKAEPQRAHRLLALREDPTRFAAARRRGLTAFVNRADDLEAIRASLRELTSVRVIDIAGEPGIGKSRLLHEFRSRLINERVLWLVGHCSSDGQQIPLLPFIDMVRRAFRVAPGEPRVSVVEKIEGGLDSVDAHTPENRDLLLNLLGLSEQGALQGLDATLIGMRTRDLLVQLLDALCRRSAVVALLEDLHWIDSASEELLARIIGRDDRLPLLILYTHRPEYRPPWSDGPRVVTRYLSPLSKGETLRIVGTRLGVAEVPEALGRLIAAKAEGNALFAEEMVSFLIERGIVRRSASGLAYDAPAVAAALPGSIQSLLTARVDRLPVANRSLLQLAAVIGRRFDLGLLAAVADAAEDDLARRLMPLEVADLVYREAFGDYVFKHALVRDALYDSVLSRVRAELHLKVAQEIEQRSAGRITEVAEVLAYHYSCTDQPEQCLRYLWVAGRKSLDIYSLEEAEEYFRQTLRVYDAAPQSCDRAIMARAVVSLLEVLYLAGNVLETKSIAERYIPEIERAGASPELVFALYFLSLMLANLCEFREAEAKARQALAVAEQTGDPKAIAYAHHILFFLSTVLGRMSRQTMEAMAAQLLTACEKASDNYILNWTYWSIAWFYTMCGLVREAHEWILKLITTGRERNDRRALGMGYWTLGWMDIQLQRHAEAAADAEEALKTAATPFDRAVSNQVKAVALLFEGRVDEGFERLRDARQWLRDHGWKYQASGVDLALALAEAARGNLRSALSMARAGMKAADANGNRQIASWYRINLAEIYIAAITAKTRPPLRLVLRNFWPILGIVLFGRRRARRLLLEARANDQFDELGTTRARIEFQLGVLAASEKRVADARSHFAQARAAAVAQGMPIIDQIDASVATLQ